MNPSRALPQSGAAGDGAATQGWRDPDDGRLIWRLIGRLTLMRDRTGSFNAENSCIINPCGRRPGETNAAPKYCT
jgi:hypothetical protein